MAETQTIAPDRQEAAGGQYLTFRLDGEEYGLEILRVREIIGTMTITAVPRTPAHVKGVINLRGKVVPVVDLRLKFGLQEVDHTDETCIIVLSVHDTEIGVVVDAVSEVRDIATGDVEPAPSFGADVDTRFILGLGKTAEQVTILLDACRVLEISDLAGLPTSETTVETPDDK